VTSYNNNVKTTDQVWGRGIYICHDASTMLASSTKHKRGVDEEMAKERGT
jgi:predicted RNA-binding protein YlxR (DUF448 family)